MLRNRLSIVALGCLALGLPACQTVGSPTANVTEPAHTGAVQEPTDVQYYPSDEPLRLGMEYFARGSFGLSERYFRDAVEKAPRDATAWIGLAASYDRLRRFDLADQAYAQASGLAGESLQLVNNLGYSYMLRGDLARARQYFLKASAIDPSNPTVRNNLHLLSESRRFIQRSEI
jgi:Flp pilus assembly protein TadD